MSKMRFAIAVVLAALVATPTFSASANAQEAPASKTPSQRRRERLRRYENYNNHQIQLMEQERAAAAFRRQQEFEIFARQSAAALDRLTIDPRLSAGTSRWEIGHQPPSRRRTPPTTPMFPPAPTTRSLQYLKGPGGEILPETSVPWSVRHLYTPVQQPSSRR